MLVAHMCSVRNFTKSYRILFSITKKGVNVKETLYLAGRPHSKCVLHHYRRDANFSSRQADLYVGHKKFISVDCSQRFFEYKDKYFSNISFSLAVLCFCFVSVKDGINKKSFFFSLFPYLSSSH